MILNKEKFRWEIILLFGFFIAQIILVIILESKYSQEIKNSSNLIPTLIIGNTIPLVITCLLIISELNPYSSNKKTLLKIKDNGFLYIPRFAIYISIFECNSLSDIYIEGFKLLNELSRYSIEINRDIKRLRLYFYAKSKIELSKNIEKAKPLLDTIFPNLYLLTSSSLRTDFLNYSLWKSGECKYVRQGRLLIIPEIERDSSSKIPQNNTHVLNYLSENKLGEKCNSNNSIQFYSFIKYEHSSLFELFGYRGYINENKFLIENIDENILLRAIIRYKLVGYQTLSDIEGYLNLQKKLTPFNEGKFNLEVRNTPILPLPKSDENTFNGNLSPLISHRYNQICKELCNIFQSSDKDEVKKKNCENRASFCKKLLMNENLTIFLDELVDGENGNRRDTILTDLLRHVSFHQIHCLITQYVVSCNSDIHDGQIIQFLHNLIKKRIDINSRERDSGKNSFSVVDSLHQRLNHEQILLE
ncbi:MAG: hypothetical protein ACXABG_16460 [Promethearchaeota archaeon]|jgi:hypothetical protein